MLRATKSLFNCYFGVNQPVLSAFEVWQSVYHNYLLLSINNLEPRISVKPNIKTY